MRQAIAGAALLVLASVAAAGATPVLEVTHHAHGHDVHVSAPAVAVLPDGTPIVAWAAREGDRKLVRLARPGSGQPAVAVTPDGLEVDALHQAPGLAIGPDGEVYVSWSSSKPKPPGTLFASDLRLSRSLDGGRTFDHHLRVNEDRPISHAFEGIAVAGDGAVIASWIDARDGGRPATWAARVVERGSRVEHAVQLDPGETCVCCRVSVAAGPDRTVAVAWRGVLPGQVRDMLVALSRDGGRTFARPSLVHADGWKITACPHRGGRLAIDGAGRLYAAWYTEGPRERPDVLFAVSADRRRFGAPRRVHAAEGTIPDQVQLAVDREGRGVVVWEDATAVRRRILLRRLDARGERLGPVQVLSRAVKAWAPAVAVAPGGFVVAWHEERFPHVATVVHRVPAPGAPGRTEEGSRR